MQIAQVIGGVNGDPSAQAIQLRMRTGFQEQVQNARLVVYDMTGSNTLKHRRGVGWRCFVATASPPKT